MKKHVLPLTYVPKIQDVRDGVCTQTIRPLGTRPKVVGDLVMFHGWTNGRYSKWSWRTPYWTITTVFEIKILDDCMIGRPRSKSRFQCEASYTIEGCDADDIAVRDGFKCYEEMYQQFKKMYGHQLEKLLFQVIRWNP